VTADLAWDSPVLEVKSDAPLVRRYRRLQSWYREHRLGVAPGPSGNRTVGSSVPKGLHRGLNFLTPQAWEHAEERIVEVQQEGGTLEPDRLLRNLLSSMPMCFNIFGSLRELEGFPELVAAVFDPEATFVGDAVCEWAPPKAEHLNDRSAFDAIVRYSTASGQQRFIGVETKYTEPFSQPDYTNDRYESVTASCGWFASGAYEALSQSAAKQLWRTVMLTAKYEETSGAMGRAAVLALAEDERAAAAVALVRQHMTSPDRLLLVTLEDLADAASGSADRRVQSWAAAFAERYLYPDRLDSASS